MRLFAQRRDAILPEAVLSPGSRIADFEVVAPLRSGGMASLFLGRRLGAAGFERPVAIKVIHPHLAQDPEFTEMFVAEALLSARIHHPNVVHVEHLGETDGQYYLVMELVDGCSLGQIQRGLHKARRRLVPRVAVSIAMQVAAGLHAAHETKDEHGELLGVVHRDVSPANVLISRVGQVKLIDFGVAKCRQTRVASVSGLIKGKLRYLAPEQALGEDVDRRTDVYALAMVLWELLTGRRLLSGETDLLLLRRAQSPSFESPRTYAPEVSPALEDVIMRALSMDRGARHPTALLFRQALAEACPEAASLDAGVLAHLVAIADGDGEQPPILADLTTERAEPSGASADHAIDTMTLDVVAAAPAEAPRRSSRAKITLAIGAAVLIAGGVVAWVATDATGTAPGESALPSETRGEPERAASPSGVATSPGDEPEPPPPNEAVSGDPETPAETTPAEMPAPAEAERVRDEARARRARPRGASRTRTGSRTRAEPRLRDEPASDVQVVDGVPVAPPPF